MRLSHFSFLALDVEGPHERNSSHRLMRFLIDARLPPALGVGTDFNPGPLRHGDRNSSEIRYHLDRDAAGWALFG
jgi:hypothetical protein